MTQINNWIGESGDGVCIRGGQPQRQKPKHPQKNDFHYRYNKINSQASYILTKNSPLTSIGISQEALDNLIESDEKPLSQTSKFDLVALDSDIQSKIQHSNVEELLNNASAILNAAEQSTLEKLGFDVVVGGGNVEIRDFFEGFGPSENNKLADMASWVAGNARKNSTDMQPEPGNAKPGTKWKDLSSSKQTNHETGETVTRTKQVDSSDPDHVKTTQKKETTFNDQPATITKTHEEDQKEDGSYAYIQTKEEEFKDDDGNTKKNLEIYKETGKIDEDGNVKIGTTSRSLYIDGKLYERNPSDKNRPLFKVKIGTSNPNPLDDGTYDSDQYEINHPELDRHRNGFLKDWDPSVDYGEDQYGSGPYTGPTFAGLQAINGGTGTGMWEVQGGPYNGSTLNGIFNSMGGTSTGSDWL